MRHLIQTVFIGFWLQITLRLLPINVYMFDPTFGIETTFRVKCVTESWGYPNSLENSFQSQDFYFFLFWGGGVRRSTFWRWKLIFVTSTPERNTTKKRWNCNQAHISVKHIICTKDIELLAMKISLPALWNTSYQSFCLFVVYSGPLDHLKEAAGMTQDLRNRRPTLIINYFILCSQSEHLPVCYALTDFYTRFSHLPWLVQSYRTLDRFPLGAVRLGRCVHMKWTWVQTKTTCLTRWSRSSGLTLIHHNFRKNCKFLD